MSQIFSSVARRCLAVLWILGDKSSTKSNHTIWGGTRGWNLHRQPVQCVGFSHSPSNSTYFPLDCQRQSLSCHDYNLELLVDPETLKLHVCTCSFLAVNKSCCPYRARTNTRIVLWKKRKWESNRTDPHHCQNRRTHGRTHSHLLIHTAAIFIEVHLTFVHFLNWK